MEKDRYRTEVDEINDEWVRFRQEREDSSKADSKWNLPDLNGKTVLAMCLAGLLCIFIYYLGRSTCNLRIEQQSLEQKKPSMQRIHDNLGSDTSRNDPGTGIFSGETGTKGNSTGYIPLRTTTSENVSPLHQDDAIGGPQQEEAGNGDIRKNEPGNYTRQGKLII